MTIEGFLNAEPELARLRKEIENCDRHDRRRLSHDEAALVRMLVGQWEQGTAGWMTAGEAAQVAAVLTGEAAEQRIAARAEVRDDRYLVFAGGVYGEQVLSLSVTSPVRARKHWAGYLEACPRAQAQQLDLITRALRWVGKMGQR